MNKASSSAAVRQVNKAFLVVGTQVRLDRGGLSAPPPKTVEGLLSLCHGWAAEVGWQLATTPAEADAFVVGPGIGAPPAGKPAVQVRRGQGIDGFRWALRSVAFGAQWPFTIESYGPLPDHVADIRRPHGDDPVGVALLLHGGFWMDAWKRGLMDGVAVDLVRRGWVTVNAEYRRVGGGGGWPGTGNDVLAAVEYAADLAGPKAPLLLVGHSAGGQLALWAAGERRDRVTQVIALAGLCDLDHAKRHGVGNGAVEQLLDAEPTSAASPIERLPLGVPVIAAHATRDTVVPVDQSRRFVEAARAAGDDAELIEVDSDDHMTLIEPDGGWSTLPGRLITRA